MGALEREDPWGSVTTSFGPAGESKALGPRKKTPQGRGEKVGVQWGGCGCMQAAPLKAASKYVGTLYLEEAATQ